MAITSSDIQNQSFSINRKGYDVDEVDVFLERVADEIDGLNGQVADLEAQLEDARFSGFDEPAADADFDEPEDLGATQVIDAVDDEAEVDPAVVADLKAQIAKLEKQLEEKGANDTAISQALIVAQRSADDLIANAKSEAAQIVADADEQAERIVAKAEADRQKIQDAIRELEDERESVRVSYRDMLNDFVDDAERKLSAIDADARKTAHAAHSAAPVETAVAPIAAGETQAYQVPMNVTAAPAAQNGYMAKDFSGYGDADDDFDFNDVD